MWLSSLKSPAFPNWWTLNVAGRLADRDVSDDTNDCDDHQLQLMLHRRRHVAERKVLRDEDPPLFLLRRYSSSNQQMTTVARGANLLTMESSKQEAVHDQPGQ